MKKNDLLQEIRRLKRVKNITVLAHYYQSPDVQDVADFVGDSLGLSIQAQQCSAECILFAGVHFMAETAKIINPESKVILPDLNAGCSLAESCSPPLFQKFISQYPDHVVISYINCSAEIKAMSDVICTSSNAERVIQSIPHDKQIIFAPDKNLGKYLIGKTGRDMVLWDGACIVHEAFALDKLVKLYLKHPDAKIIAHPESEKQLLEAAHYIGSTTAMIDFVKRDTSSIFIVATEVGILHAMRKEVQEKIIIPAPTHENNTCACSECGFMKLNTLEKIYYSMEYEYPVIEVEESLRVKALRPLLRMLQISKN
jgi:quinolinate synthase